MDEAFWTLALQVLEKGGPFAFIVMVIVGGIIWLQVKLGRPAASGVEAQMTAALKSLEERINRNHETAEAHREELKDSMSDLGQRVARIEGRMEGL